MSPETAILNVIWEVIESDQTVKDRFRRLVKWNDDPLTLEEIQFPAVASMPQLAIDIVGGGTVSVDVDNNDFDAFAFVAQVWSNGWSLPRWLDDCHVIREALMGGNGKSASARARLVAAGAHDIAWTQPAVPNRLEGGFGRLTTGSMAFRVNIVRGHVVN